jgi:uncharacterized membrane protein
MYQWVVWVHILAAMVWVGGMLFVAMVLVPALRGRDAGMRAEMMGEVGRRFSNVTGGAFAILLVTGVWNLHNRGFSWHAIYTGEVLGGVFGHILAVKLLLVLAAVAVSAVHDFVVGPASVRAAAASDTVRADSLRRTTSWIGRLNALLALAIIWHAVMLVRGLPW